LGLCSPYHSSLRTSWFQSRKRFRHCWSFILSLGSDSTAACFNRESDSVTVGATQDAWETPQQVPFQSRKRFRHCWSHSKKYQEEIPFSVSIAKAIPSLLEHQIRQLRQK